MMSILGKKIPIKAFPCPTGAPVEMQTSSTMQPSCTWSCAMIWLGTGSTALIALTAFSLPGCLQGNGERGAEGCAASLHPSHCPASFPLCH